MTVTNYHAPPPRYRARWTVKSGLFAAAARSYPVAQVYRACAI